MAHSKETNQAGKVRRSSTAVSEATLNNVRICPRKIRLSVDLIRGKQVDTALQILRFDKKKGSAIVAKLIASAVANAKEQASVDVDKLWVINASADTGRTLKRFMARAQGRATDIMKRSSNVRVELGVRG